MNEERIKRIIECEAEADKHYQKEQEHYQEEQERRWEAARLIAEELAEGTSQRTLATKIGKSKPHVMRCNMAWQKYGTLGSRPGWNEAYQEFKYHDKPGREQDQEKPDDEYEEEFGDDDEFLPDDDDEDDDYAESDEEKLARFIKELSKVASDISHLILLRQDIGRRKMPPIVNELKSVFQEALDSF